MPQMMPINWIISFILFILIFTLFNIMNFYIYNNNNNFKNPTLLKYKKTLLWKW